MGERRAWCELLLLKVPPPRLTLHVHRHPIPCLQLFCFRTAVMPEQVVAGAARWQDIVFAEPQLHSRALQEGVLHYGQWGVPTGDGGFAVRCLLQG